METDASRTFSPGNDGFGTLAAILAVLFAAPIAAVAAVQARNGGVAAAFSSWPAAAIMFGLLGALVALQGYRSSFRITCDPDGITWSDWFGRERLRVADITECIVRWNYANRSNRLYYTLVFELADAGRRSTQSLFADQFPDLIPYLRRHYRFTVGFDPERGSPFPP
jgi:hypothetical protein